MENKEEINKGGRPPLWSSPELMQDSINHYFDELIKKPKERATITGLCLHLGFESRQSFYAYEQKDEFSYTIKRARLKIENVYENMLGTVATTGAIFALKNFDWADKQEIDHTSGGKELKHFTLNVKPDNT